LLADERGLKTVAFSAISTGVYGYPIDMACKIAYDTICKVLPSTKIEHVLLVCFNDEVYNAYLKAMDIA